jgi:Uma2 family endonuclease
MTAIAERRLSAQEYLELERRSETRHEFVNGILIPVPGASKIHSRIVFNITVSLAQAVVASDARLHQGDTQLLTASGRFYYPDVMIVLADNGDPYLEETPCFIAEVLSKSTENADRGAKLEAYCKIATLERYVLIEQDSKFVTVYARDRNGWRVAFLDGMGSVEIPCLKAELGLEQVYNGVEFDP